MPFYFAASINPRQVMGHADVKNKMNNNYLHPSVMPLLGETDLATSDI